MLRRSPLTRKTPLKATTGLQRTPFKRRAPKKRPGHEPKYLAACRGELESVVPCHANWSAYGKGMGIKAPDIYTVPGCARCHACLDQGMTLTKAEKKATWEWAYTRWSAARDSKIQEAA
ncbi:hypothetical protein [Achromobacter xylosoxidans]